MKRHITQKNNDDFDGKDLRAKNIGRNFVIHRGYFVFNCLCLTDRNAGLLWGILFASIFMTKLFYMKQKISIESRLFSVFCVGGVVG